MMTKETMQMAAFMQRASEFGEHGHAESMSGEPKAGERFRQAREKHAQMSDDEHAARRFGRNPKGYTPSAV